MPAKYHCNGLEAVTGSKTMKTHQKHFFSVEHDVFGLRNKLYKTRVLCNLNEEKWREDEIFRKLADCRFIPFVGVQLGFPFFPDAFRFASASFDGRSWFIRYLTINKYIFREIVLKIIPLFRKLFPDLIRLLRRRCSPFNEFHEQVRISLSGYFC